MSAAAHLNQPAKVIAGCRLKRRLHRASEKVDPARLSTPPTDPTAEGSGPAESEGHSANMLEPRPPLGSAAYQGVLDKGNR